ncbi:MAG: hypothetical protein C7B43_18175 [Sulfobacillus benefaciens]|jgi:pimeloyl-ACP methyl ester carboxylesterase|uniref:Peptidase S9 prolyl oligopeptidase catalytic domain-containing protein n=1 Tax=Sulfobacillus benefaciens TaxID=453960 RepID=A0A2T2WRC7_9FIRM|nr:MAG: hypothetical protein C7B43_18175 [Sulfobacillus benefaciens]
MRDSATQKQSILVISDFPDVVQGDLATQLGLDGTDGVDAEIRTLRLGEMEGNASSDIFYAGYVKALTGARQQAGEWLLSVDQAWLVGFGLGGLVALWAAADNRDAPIRGVAVIGGTPNFEFLKGRHPYYDWPADHVKKTLLDWDVSYKVPRIGNRAVLLLHGDDDREIGTNWIEEFFLLATGVSRWPDNWEYHRIHGLGHQWDPRTPAVDEARQYLLTFRQKIFLDVT